MSCLQLGALKRRQPIASLDLRVDEFAVGDGDESGHPRDKSRDQRPRARWLAQDYELSAHAHDLAPIGVEIYLSIERRKACRVAEVWRHVKANDGNRAR